MSNVTCNNCGWVHFAVTKHYAKKQIRDFADYWNSSPVETKLNFFKYGASPEELPSKYDEEEHYQKYTKCLLCGESYKNFRESKEEDCPIGCTIGPILDYKEYNDNEGLSL